MAVKTNSESSFNIDYGNLVGATMGLYGAHGDYFANLANALTEYAGASLNAMSQIQGSEMTRWGAKYRLRDAGRAMGYAGDVQRSGEEAAVNRYLQLGQDVGRVYAGAAAGNIDVGSRSVRSIDAAARMMAKRDVDATNLTTSRQANQYVEQARNARLQAVGDNLAADQAKIQGMYQMEMARSNKKMAKLSAMGQYLDSWTRFGLSAGMAFAAA